MFTTLPVLPPPKPLNLLSTISQIKLKSEHCDGAKLPNGISRWKKYRSEPAFNISKAVSRSTVYRQWVPHSGCGDGEGTRCNRSEYWRSM